MSSIAQPHEEEEGQKAPELPTCTPACAASQEGLAPGSGCTSRSPLGPLSEPPTEKHRATPGSPPHLPSHGLAQRGDGRCGGLSEGSPAVDSSPEADRPPLNFSLPGGTARTTPGRLERAFRRQGNQPVPLR